MPASATDKFCTDSKRENLSDFLAFISKVATILNYYRMLLRTAQQLKFFWLPFKRKCSLFRYRNFFDAAKTAKERFLKKTEPWKENSFTNMVVIIDIDALKI